MGLKVKAFKNFNKWTPAKKTTKDEEKYILNKCSHFN